MAELTGQPGFAPPKKQQTGSRRRQATMIELLATATLTVSLVVAATAVSMGNKPFTRGNFLEKTTVQSPRQSAASRCNATCDSSFANR